jgi:hypothetical protein
MAVVLLDISIRRRNSSAQVSYRSHLTLKNLVGSAAWEC